MEIRTTMVPQSPRPVKNVEKIVFYIDQAGDGTRDFTDDTMTTGTQATRLRESS